jgi:hypothetical protein
MLSSSRASCEAVNPHDEEAVMRRTFVLALAALALLGVVAPSAFAQVPAAPAAAPAPTFKINGLIDQVGTYTKNMSAFDGSLGRNSDTQFYGRTRGRFDFIGEYGKAKAVLGIEIDEYWGQTGFGDSNGAGSTTCVTSSGATVTCGATGSGAESSFDLNTDTQSNLQIKWLYTEFELPLIPVPTVVRLGGQPFGSAANYKLATYATGDFGGVNIVSTITPNVKLLFTYAGVEEALTKKTDIGPVSLIAPVGGTFPQARGDDFAVIVSAEVTPFRGLDVKPMYSYFYANGNTSGNARQGRGGYSIAPSTAPPGTAGGSPFAPKNVSGADAVGTGVHEDRHTVGLDARWRFGPWSLDPTVLYQFGDRVAFNTITPAYGILCNSTGNAATNCLKHTAEINAWLVDVRAGFQLGPMLFQWLGMWSSGNQAKDTLLRHVNFFQPLDTDTSYLADWGTQITSLGVDYYQILQGATANVGVDPGVAIGYDKYGRIQTGLKASYALTPNLNFGAGWTILWTDKKVDTDAVLIGNAGLLPSFVSRTTGRSARPEGESRLIGNEIDATLTWRFAPGLALDLGAGYLFAGAALGHRVGVLPYCEAGGVNGPCASPTNKDRKVEDVIIGTARVRFTF